MGSICQNTANHSGARRIGSHFQKSSDPIAVGLVYGCRKVKTVQSLIKNGRSRFLTGQAIGPAQGTAVKANTFGPVRREKGAIADRHQQPALMHRNVR